MHGANLYKWHHWNTDSNFSFNVFMLHYYECFYLEFSDVFYESRRVTQ